MSEDEFEQDERIYRKGYDDGVKAMSPTLAAQRVLCDRLADALLVEWKSNVAIWKEVGVDWTIPDALTAWREGRKASR